MTKQSRIYRTRLPRSPAKAASLAMTNGFLRGKHFVLLGIDEIGITDHLRRRV